jgi:hypothetical protein
MSWLFSRALVEAFSAECSSDGEQSAPSRSTPMPQAYLPSDKMTAFSRLSRFGMMFAHLTDARGAELLTSFLEASRARTSPAPEREPGSTASAQGFGANLPASLAKYDHASSSWKTAQCSLFGGSEPFSGIWPRWGSMRGGECWELSTPERRIKGRDYVFWQTPTVQDSNGRDRHNQRDGSTRPSLLGQARMWPTPTVNDARNSTLLESQRNRDGLAGSLMRGQQAGGQLNPEWVEWLMGWPLGWTDLEPLEMDRFQQWLSAHGRR